jgi:CRP-like cAMP-binding protein
MCAPERSVRHAHTPLLIDPSSPTSLREGNASVVALCTGPNATAGYVVVSKHESQRPADDRWSAMRRRDRRRLMLPGAPLNKLLAALPPAVCSRLQPHLEHVSLKLGASVYEAGGKQAYVYFPIDSIVSLLYVMQDGASAEIAVVGNDGLVGISLFMGGETTPSRAVVQSAGSAYRLRAKRLKAEFEFGGELQHLLLRYTQALITQMAQTAVCNRHHSIEQQLCRWLLLSADRLPSNVLTMTQDLIANMLGVRREGVTASAGKLQESGLIRYSRGRITILNRAGLEKRVCECYAVVKRECDRLLPHSIATQTHLTA